MIKKHILIILLTAIYTSNVFCVNNIKKIPTIHASNGELVPSEIFIPEDLEEAYSYDYSIYGPSLPNELRTFDVTPHHEILPDGVKFNIEDVSLASNDDLNKPKISLAKYKDDGLAEVNLFYNGLKSYEDQKQGKSKQKKLKKLDDIEIFSEMPTDLVFSGSSGIIAACVTAFSRHLPLTLKPDHIWMLILHAFCQNVNQNAEELRSKIVSHEGKKKIIIKVDSLVKGFPSALLWESEVFPLFATKIRENLASKELHDIITKDFSITAPIDRSCKEIILMGATVKYFDFTKRTDCGIPNIKLLGSEADWQSIIDRTKALSEYMTPEFKEFWLPKLIPVLEKFVDAFRGNIDYTFWQTMVKLRITGGGSGDYDFISGWIQILFPYFSYECDQYLNLNTQMKPWNKAYFSGPEIKHFTDIMTSVPVIWEYNGLSFDMHYHAGIVGFSQNPEDGSLMPVTGWRISYDEEQKSN